MHTVQHMTAGQQSCAGLEGADQLLAFQLARAVALCVRIADREGIRPGSQIVDPDPAEIRLGVQTPPGRPGEQQQGRVAVVLVPGPHHVAGHTAAPEGQDDFWRVVTEQVGCGQDEPTGQQVPAALAAAEDRGDAFLLRMGQCRHGHVVFAPPGFPATAA